MNLKHGSKLIPVLRRPRREWQIPDLKAQERLAEEQEAAAQAKAFCAGTTPYGRDIFRRVLYLAGRRLQENKSLFETTKEVEAEMNDFPELWEEFVLLLSRILAMDADGQSSMDADKLRQGSPYAWAAIIVFRAQVNHKLNQIHQEQAMNSNHIDA